MFSVRIMCWNEKQKPALRATASFIKFAAAWCLIFPHQTGDIITL